jgi:hypothetical protein
MFALLRDLLFGAGPYWARQTLFLLVSSTRFAIRISRASLAAVGKIVISVVARTARGAFYTRLKQALLALWALFTTLCIMGKCFAAFRGVFDSEAFRTGLEHVHSLLRAPYFTNIELDLVPSVDTRSYGWKGGCDIFMSIPVIEICMFTTYYYYYYYCYYYYSTHVFTDVSRGGTPPAGHFRQEGSFSAPSDAFANGLRE